MADDMTAEQDTLGQAERTQIQGLSFNETRNQLDTGGLRPEIEQALEQRRDHLVEEALNKVTPDDFPHLCTMIDGFYATEPLGDKRNSEGVKVVLDTIDERISEAVAMDKDSRDALRYWVEEKRRDAGLEPEVQTPIRAAVATPPPQPEQQTAFRPSWVMEMENEYTDPTVARIARQLHRNSQSMNTLDYLRGIFGDVQRRVINGDLPEEATDLLLLRIQVQIEDLEANPPVPVSSPLETTLGEVAAGLTALVSHLERSGQLNAALTPDQIARMTRGDVLNGSADRTDQLRRAFGRLAPEEERDRWIDVEVDQEFYTRFSPGQEPYFYSESPESERREWNARWALARAAFYKKIYGAMPDKLAENQDLISLSKEHMEALYSIEGVKEALSWYVSKIISGEEITEVDREVEVQRNGRTFKEVKKVRISFLDCSDGVEFKAIRQALRDHLQETVFKGQDDPADEDEERALLMKLKSADAIAWNLIFCGNLVESIDSRYSVLEFNIGKEGGKAYKGARIEKRRNEETGREYTVAIYQGKGRHAGLAPSVCSDDLRAVFHPQEKFENKCSSGLEWGAFGKWGQTQTDQIKRELKFDDSSDAIAFQAATRKAEYWAAARINQQVVDEEGVARNVIVVRTPECYPTATLRSFFEEYGLLQQMLKGEINWHRVDANSWQTSYLTVRLRKAVGLAEYFAGKNPFDPKKEREWVINLLDCYRRLKLDKRPDYHNIKVWAFYASMGGVTKPHHREVTPPLVGTFSKAGLVDMASKLRDPVYGYLKRGTLGFGDENLEIKG